MKTQTILISGAAGFIGSSLAKVLQPHHHIIGIDNYYPNYSVTHKQQTIKNLKIQNNFVFIKTDIRNTHSLQLIFHKYNVDIVLHLAALTGVRTSLKNPKLYFEVNVKGTQLLYIIAAQARVKQFIFSSSSSVYGYGNGIPFSEDQPLSPTSPYANSKKEAEEVIRAYQLHYRIPTTILRLFSVYGPNGRPDMAPYIFTEAALLGKKIVQFGQGKTARDYTYIDDVIEAFQLVLEKPHVGEIINIGASSPVTLGELVTIVEKYTGRTVKKILQPILPSESRITYADVAKAKKLLRWQPKTSFSQGMQKFILWYKMYRSKNL